MAYTTDDGLVVRDWRTGAVRTVAKVRGFLASIDLRDDGRALIATDEGELFDVPPGGPARRIARAAGKPRFAGEHIVFRRGGALRVIDPGGRVRTFGVRSTRLGAFTTDGTRVLWEANGCLLVAPVADPAAAAPEPGPCPRSELTRVDGPNPRLSRSVPVTLRCVAAPRNCRGTLRLRADGAPLNPPRRFSIPAGRAHRFNVRLGERGYRALRRHVERDDGALVTIEARIDGHRVRPSGPDILIEPRRGRVARMAAGVVGSLVAQIEDELDAVVDAIGNRIRAEIPDFQRLPVDTLATAVRGNVSRALAALRELRDPTPDELERAAAIGRERAEQGLTVDAVLHAYRISITAVWSRFGEMARAQGADVATVLAFSETLWRWADAVMDVVAAAHREVELEHAREEQQRRDAFVFALLTGTLDPDELRRESATFGLDPEREYVPFRARGASHRAALALGTMFIALDHDVAGLASRVPVAPPGVTVGYAAPAPLEALPTGFAHASRALQTALAFGEQGAFSLADLSIRPAILADEALGDAFAERHLAPLAGLGMELEDTLRTYLDQGMRIEDTARMLHVHANTLRHRLKRFEETTGTNLRDPRTVVELWWALERSRLKRT